MAEIHELSETLANQIAAGEVIERPASVVKELVENALDAKARQVEIKVKASGLEQIQVTDDGQGIAQSEVSLAFKRHATSKISSKEDLFKVFTLGFRGEALPSIASVAQVELKTARQGEAAGSTIQLKGGQILDQKAAQLRKGTQITVTDLFYNTPARLKYLRSQRTELAHITDIVDRLALGHVEVAFTLKNNDKVILKTAGNNKQLQTFSAIYGLKTAKKMLAFQTEDADFKVSGLISLPEETRSNRNGITLLINGRYVKNFALIKAVLAGYGSKLMVGRFPYAVVNIELDPLLCDVNVHPTKKEVRLSKENELAHLLTQAIYQRIAQENLIPDANLDESKLKIQESSQAYKNIQPEKTELIQTLLGEPKQDVSPNKPIQVEPLIIKSRQDLTSPLAKKWDEKYAGEKMPAAKDEPAVFEEMPLTKTPSTRRFPDLLYIGQLHGTYLLAESQAGLYLIDQHAAQERCNYERLRVEIGQVGGAQQNLLVPIVLSYSTSDALKIAENMDKIWQLGLHLEDFGTNTYVLHSHPVWFKEGHEEQTLKELLGMLLNDPNLTVAKFREKTAIMMSCKQAIKANHHLEPGQAKALLAQLAQCENPFNCPHGRPVLVHFGPTDLEKMFKRIQDPHQSGFQNEF